MSLVIAITGANGLVGQGLTRAALDQGHSVVALDIPTNGAEAFKSEPKTKYIYHQLDATDFDRYLALVKDSKCTAVVHLAATFNKFDDNGVWMSNVPSHVRPTACEDGLSCLQGRVLTQISGHLQQKLGNELEHARGGYPARHQPCRPCLIRQRNRNG